MLDQEMKDQVQKILENLHSEFELRLRISPQHPNRAEAMALLDDLCSLSERISLSVEDGEGISIAIVKDGVEASFTFECLPSGHEFSSLVLAILNLDGGGRNLPDEQFAQRIMGLQGEVEVVSYILLSCPNCPDVVQAMNVISIVNPRIKHRIVDGALVGERMESLGIQAVPTLYIGDELLHVGRATLGDLVDSLEQHLVSEVQYEAQSHTFDVVVLGGGPAGVTAALYAARKGFIVALVSENIGGQTLQTQAVDNIPSIQSIQGSEYAARLREQVERYPITIFNNRTVESVERVGDSVTMVYTSLNEDLQTRALIIATGAQWRELGIEGERE